MAATGTTSSPSLAQFGASITLFGCGKMAGAMLDRWLACGLPAAHVTAIRASGAPVAPGVMVQANRAGLTAPDILIIGVKPQAFGSLAADIAALAGPNTVVLSIMAGVTLDALQDALPDAGGIVRVMPNMPVRSGAGVVIRCGAASDDADTLLAPLGLVHSLPDEQGFNLLTALTGCGPAFVYRFTDALAGAAVRLGLDSETAERLARATVAGSGAMLASDPATPGEMVSAVASPGGMTQAGLDVLDSEGRLTGLVAETLRAARDRGRELGG